MFQSRQNLAVIAASLLFSVGCSAPTSSDPAAPADIAAAPSVVKSAYVAHRDSDFDVPTFVWLEPAAPPPAGSKPADVAWQALRQIASTYHLGDSALALTSLRGVHDTGRGSIIVHFEQRLASYDVFRLRINVAMNRELQPLAASGYLAPRPVPIADTFTVDQASAIAAAKSALVKLQLAANVADTLVAPTDPFVDATPPRARRTWFPRPEGLVPAYYIELDRQRGDTADSEMHSFVISAIDGSVLFDKDLTAADSFTYRVFADKDKGFTPWDGPQGTAFSPHPTGKPDGTTLSFLPSNAVTLESAPFSRRDPWLPAGSLEARGNNAVAYADLVAPDGLSTGDVMLVASSPGVFDYGLDVSTQDPAANVTTIRAVTTNFFYMVNFMHDYFYDAGYDEAAGNAQMNNYGRGGVEGDPIRAESQDSSGRNNANASTPADGASPRIQMYLWDPTKQMHISKPASLVGDYVVGAANFGPKIFSLTQDALLVDDGVDPASDGCEAPFKNAAALAGKIALIDRGTCAFEMKTYNAQLAGAVGVVIMNNVPGAPGTMGVSNPLPPMPVTIPALMISQDDGNAIKKALMGGDTVNLSMLAPLANNDSSLDGTIVAHEWGHTLSNRLIGNGSGLNNTQGAGMGEGWSDFVAMLTIVRGEDVTLPSGANWSGVYPVSAYAAGPGGNSAYYGIRRYPYSADMTKAPLTFKHIQLGTPLPTMPPPVYGGDGSSNSEVHATGEVWTNMLFECYVALLRDSARYTFADANRAMRDYLVGGLKLTPNSPTILEARDAILAAIYASSAEDFALCTEAFARRGAGLGAVGPDRSSGDNVGVVESYAAGADFSVVDIKLDDAVHSCDHDGILDNDEVGHLTVTLRNTGSIPLLASATISSSNPAVSDDNGGQITFPTVAPFATTTATLNMTMKGAPANQSFDVTLVINAQKKAIPGAVTVKRTFHGNYDVVYGTSPDDTMDDKNPVWNVAYDSKLDISSPWMHDDQQGYWSIPDTAAPSDHYLISPPLQVATSGSFGFTLRHRFSFEFDTSNNYDGAVIEISSDNGMTWKDTDAQLVMNGYTGTLWNQNLPLTSRRAFTAQSMGYPSFITTTADFGTAYQGQTVRVRFRVGTDPASGAAGWDLDEIHVTGITNTPFSSRTLTHTTCANQPPVISGTTISSAHSGQDFTLQAKASDPDGDLLTFRWTQESGPMVMLDDYQVLQPTFSTPKVSERTVMTFKVIANDGTVDSQPVIFQVAVMPPDDAGSGTLPPAQPSSGCSMSQGRTESSAAVSVGILLALCALVSLRRRLLPAFLLLAVGLGAGCNSNDGGTELGLYVSRDGSGAGKVVAQPGGIDCGAACAAVYKEGTQVTLTASVSDGKSQFSGWKGACSGSAPTCTVTLSMAQSVTAVFDGPPAPLAIVKSGDGDGTITSSPAGLSCGATCNAMFPDDTTVTLHAAPGAQASFVGWSGDCEGAALDCTIRANSSRSVTARFESRICSTDGLCWERSWPQGNNLNAVQVVSANDVWTAGEVGTLVHYDGQRFARAQSGTTRNLRALWAWATNDIWAAGEAGTLLHYDGTKWSAGTSGVTVDLYSVWGTATNDVWAVGDGGVALHYDGTAWTKKDLGAAVDESLRAISGNAGNSVFAISTAGNVFRYDGTAWTKSNISQRRLLALWVGAANSAWAVGDFGAAYNWDGTTWTAKAATTIAGNLVAVYGATADSVFVASSQSVLAQRMGTTWQTVTSPSSTPLQAIHGAAPNLWMVGSHGALVRWDGSVLKAVSTGTEPRSFTAAWSSDTNRTWLVGAQGLVGRYAGAGLTHEESGLAADLLAVHGTSDRNVWVVGENGAAAHFDGNTWAVTATGIAHKLYGVWTSGQEAWAVGELGIVLHHDGKAWSLVNAKTDGDLYAIWGSSSTDIWVAGANEFAHFDGTTWKKTTQVSGVIYALSGRAQDDVYAVGAAGALYHCDGSAWLPQSSGTTLDLRAVAATSNGEVYIAGQQGLVLHGVGGKLSPMKSDSSATLYSLAAFDAHSVWFIGGAGLFSYRR